MQEKYLNREQMQAILDTRPKSISLKDAIDTYVKNGWTIQDINDQNLKSNQSVANKYGSDGSNVPAITTEPNPIAQSFGKTVNNLADRATQVGSAVKNVGTDLSNTQTLPEAAKVVGKNFVSATGAVGGGLADILTGGVEVAAKSLNDMSGGKLGEYGGKALASVLNTTAGKQAVQAISNGQQAWSEYERTNPEEAKVYKDIFDTLNIIPVADTIKAGAKVITKGAEIAANVAEKGVNAVGDAVAAGVSKGINTASDAAKSVTLPKVNLGKTTSDYLNKIYKESPLPADEVLASRNKVENALGMFKSTPLEVTNVKTGAKEIFDIKKATPQQLFEAVNSLSKTVANTHRAALKELSKTPENLIKDFSDVQALLDQRFNDGYISNALRNKVMKQLSATGGDLNKVDDWITKANQYFGSEADSRILAQDVAKILRSKLDAVVDRAGYADSFGSVQELKKLIVNSIAKETKDPAILESLGKNSVDVAFNLLTKNPLGIGIQATRGLKALFGGSGDIKIIQKAGSKAIPTEVKGAAIKEAREQIKSLNGKKEAKESLLESVKKEFKSGNLRGSVTIGKSPANDLLQEAKKYKSAEEFVKAKTNPSEYAMSHRPTDGVRAFDLTEKVDGEQMIPKDMYEQWYGSRGTIEDKQSIAALKSIKGKPDAEITIYRASPSKDFNYGDWVTFSKDYAKTHAEGNGGKVYSKVVRAKDVRWAMDDINEFGYFPEDYKSQLTDIWNKANKK